MSKKQKPFECQCDSCKGACRYCPGWFLPGEAENAAKHIGLSLKAFFDKYLAVTWWEGDEPIFVLAPALVGQSTGTEYPGDPRGACVFFNDEELCEIHPAKPHERAAYFCDAARDSVHSRHRAVADAWAAHQAQVVELLGRGPIAAEFNMFDFILGGIR